MYKYYMNLACIVEDTEQTWFSPQMDAQTDGQTERRVDKVKPVYTPFQFFEAGGIKKWVTHGYIDGSAQENVPPLLMHWSYIFFPLTYVYDIENNHDKTNNDMHISKSQHKITHLNI